MCRREAFIYDTKNVSQNTARFIKKKKKEKCGERPQGLLLLISILSPAYFKTFLILSSTTVSRLRGEVLRFIEALCHTRNREMQISKSSRTISGELLIYLKFIADNCPDTHFSFSPFFGLLLHVAKKRTDF